MVEDLRQLLTAEQPTGEFKPYCYFGEDADSLTVYFKGDADFSRRLTDHVTLFLSLNGGELVGCRIKGISEILRDLPNYIDVDHGDIRLSMVFWSFRGGAENAEVRNAFNRLAKEAGRLNLIVPNEASAV